MKVKDFVMVGTVVIVVTLIAQAIPGAVPKGYRFEREGNECYYQENFDNHAMCMEPENSNPTWIDLTKEEINEIIR